MPPDYPVMLHIAGRPCVVVGGGPVAARKVTGLLDAGAQVTVISPQISPDIHQYRDHIHWEQKQFSEGDLTAYRPFLVFAATNQPEVNQQVVREAQQLGALANRTDDAESGDFSNMVALHRPPLTVALSTNGASPALSKHLKNVLDEVIGDEYGVLAGWLRDLRPLAAACLESQAQRQQLYETIIASDILTLLRQNEPDMARQAFDQFMVGWGIS